MDCLDALASDRQYRKALPLHEAMAKVASEAGTSFDPRVVGILQRRYVELERLANEQPLQAPAKLSTDIKVERGSGSGGGVCGVGESDAYAQTPAKDTIAVMAAAASKARERWRSWRQAGIARLSLEDTLSLLAVRVKHLVPHDSMAVYVVRKEVLVPEFVSGENFRLFSSLRIPIGEGLSGWVAQNRSRF